MDINELLRPDPETIIVAGDVHGDPQFLAYIYDCAFELQVGAIVQVGDFGYWEHHPDGGAFLDVAAEGFRLTDVPLFWLDGNHENHPLLRSKYGPGGPEHDPTPEGFWRIRPGVYYIPRATRWEWAGIRFMALGGARSFDKNDRIKAARKDGHTRWWPEEELTDEDVALALADPEPVDVLFTHDKPRDAQPPWSRRDHIPSLPNQDKVQKVMNALHPKVLIHGHLHIRYTTKVDRTVVEGLACNPQKPTDDPLDAWIKLSLVTAPRSVLP